MVINYENDYDDSYCSCVVSSRVCGTLLSLFAIFYASYEAYLNSYVANLIYFIRV